jgi:hypothetical protein
MTHPICEKDTTDLTIGDDRLDTKKYPPTVYVAPNMFKMFHKARKVLVFMV